MENQVSRRSFVRGAVVAGAAAAMAGLAGCGKPSNSDELAATGGSSIDWNEQADIVVIGAGPSGSATALAASQAGASVILLEASAVMGGNGILCVGCIQGYGTKMQKDMGIEDTPEAAIKDFKEEGGYYATEDSLARIGDDWPLIELLANESARTVDWLVENGVALAGPFCNMTYKGGPANGQVPRTHVLYPTSREWPSVVQPKIEEAGGVIKFQTKGMELVMDGERVAGVKAVDQVTQEELLIGAGKGVVIATNGVEAAYDYLAKCYAEPLARVDASNSFNDGYGMRMAEKIGAATTGYDNPATPAIRSQAPGPNVGVHSGVLRNGGIFVTSEGVRFANEDQSGNEMVIALNALPDRVGYLVFDDVTAQNFNTPPAAYSSMAGQGDGTLNDFVEVGAVMKADTIEEAAAAAGLDGAAVAAEVAHYNAMAEAGVDDDFGRAKNFRPINNPPYYVHGPQKAQFLQGNFSLSVTTNFEVKDTYGNVIPGLYACGAAGRGRAITLPLSPGNTHGANMSMAFTSGRLVGEHLAAL